MATAWNPSEHGTPLGSGAQPGDSIPWYLWCAVLAVTSVSIGAHWDVSWHRSIGRDSFWTPAHMAIYACGVLAAISCGYLVLHTTFRKPPAMVASSVEIFGLRAPLGAFIASWGGVAMLTSAPFDNWWHNAYGLDVKIVSPPHTLLMLGVFSVSVGTLIMLLGAMNRATDGSIRRHLQWLMLYVGGLMVVALFGAIVFRLLRAAQIARDPLGRLLCAGALALLAYSAIQNVGMTIGLIPIAGIPLPFVSYGGSAMIVFFATVGLVVNVELRRSIRR